MNAAVDVSQDLATFLATPQPGGPFAFDPFLSSPPPGTCSVAPGIGDFYQSGEISRAPAAALDAGTQLTVNGPGGQQTSPLASGEAALGSYLPLYSFPNQLFLAPGKYAVASKGGADVSAFSTNVTAPGVLNWTNRDQITTVPRGQSLILNWSGAANQVSIVGVSSDLPTNSGAIFVCTAPPGATSFTVPAEVLSALPAARTVPLASKSVIYLVSSNVTTFTATGLKTGVAAGSYIAGKTVIFQ